MTSLTAIRFERRLHVESRQATLVRIGGAVAGLLIAGFLLLCTGRNPFWLLWKSIDGTFLHKQGLEETAVVFTPILTNALAVHIGMRMKAWNIGSEGQFYMGAWAAAGIGVHWAGPRYLELVLMGLAGLAAGAGWIAVPALARAYWGVNEIITTLLLNFVALQIVAWYSFDIWRDKKASVIQSTPVSHVLLPFFPGSKTLYIGIIFPLIIAAIFFVVFRSSKWGYEVDMIGGNPRAAEFAGIKVKRRMVSVLLISGAIAGLSGMLHLAGPAKRLNSSISTSYGLSGFIVAALAGASVLGVVGGAVFIATMLQAGTKLRTEGLSINIIGGVYGLVLLGIAIGEVAARFRVVRPSREVAVT
jgi:simple sugar transport system permease protein